jgi:L-lactate dehydrogenase complex protein LldG
METITTTVIERVRKALGRSATSNVPPTPPAIEEPVVRLVGSNIGLTELFIKRAGDLKMHAHLASIDDVLPKVSEFLRQAKVKSVVVPDVPLLMKLDVVKFLNDNGFVAKWWSQITLDDAYEYDAGVTDVYKAVAETASLVLKFGPNHGRIISLAPFVHVAIVEPKDLLPDLLDLFELLSKERCASGVCMISGPSKTADIEMNVVTGVHGPNIVGAFILQ